jgi:uncharacterized protein YjbI with pentapeptide repeats
MSTTAKFLGKMFLCRDGNYRDPYNLDGIGGTHTFLNVYANGRNVSPQFTGVACQGVEPVKGPGKPSDLKHLTRGPARPGEPPAYIPLVVGADDDSRDFGIDFTQARRVFAFLYRPDVVIPGITPQMAAYLRQLADSNPAYFQKAVSFILGVFNCRSRMVFGNIYWWWGIGWMRLGSDVPPYTPDHDNTSIVYSYTPSADDWRSGATIRPTTDYEWCDLSGEDYSHLTLKDAKFGNADVSGTDFTGCDLSNAVFSGVYSMKHAKLVNARLDHANLSGVDLDGVDLSGTSLIGTNLSKTDLTKAIFNTPPTLSHDLNARTSFEHSTVPWSVLQDPTRDGSKIDLTTLILAYATLVGVPEVLHDLDASNADVRGIVLTKKDLKGAKFVHAHAEAIDLSGSRLANASFQFAFLASDAGRSASLANADLMDANFSNADLTGAVLTGASLWGSTATLESATLVQTNFANAYLGAADFRGIAGKQCSGVDFSGACLVNAKFAGTTTQRFESAPTNFVNACLYGADFEGAHLVDATNLSNASVSFASGSFPVTLPMKWPPRPVPFDPPLHYDATQGLGAATTATSICPSSGFGPCTDSQLHIDNPVTHWPPG